MVAGEDQAKALVDSNALNYNLQQKELDLNAVTIYKPLSPYEMADFTIRFNNYWFNYDELKDGTYEYQSQHTNTAASMYGSTDTTTNITLDTDRDNWSTKVTLAVKPYDKPDNWGDMTNTSKIESAYINGIHPYCVNIGQEKNKKIDSVNEMVIDHITVGLYNELDHIQNKKAIYDDWYLSKNSYSFSE